ncbi:SnoaL-like domain-containing protein [Chitinophaga terrae (ex Kim and Jung 2007)]|uniref:SnoaL-like domain-containing protein n=1 Tax=Chitinophaga terrae (ex Kim and Jung 2007) TaxID=408074 RepID=A0A1H4G9J3_9BACT|nr:nuclear transport factor 2 family protein [Chitinophaga terrae (ex Kim and Jung 2007)]GEP93261.1 hypothetical protein CTE07_49060 [Chitinophaga terrae (ex Kim and Jung 2007)]SEB06323.1 SnoaL-like domain-containing protein [Chitinophaga terrae (ex Kim and Jung 2007)]
MIKIQVQADCGNAPKKMFVKDFIIAIVNNDQASLEKNATDDIQWTTAGGETIEGKEAVLAALRRFRSDKVAELTIHTIITHGYDGMAEGLLKFKDGRKEAFCDVYRFKASTNHAPVKNIRTYTVEPGNK